MAFWGPDAPVQAGAQLRFAYRLSWGFAPEGARRLGVPPSRRRVSRRAASRGRAASSSTSRRTLGKARGRWRLATLHVARCCTPRAEVHAISGGYRAAFELLPDGDAPVELRCFLKRGSETLTETWSYLWIP